MATCKNCAGNRLDKKGRCHYCGTQIETHRNPDVSQFVNYDPARNAYEQQLAIAKFNQYQQSSAMQQDRARGMQDSALYGLSGGLAEYMAGGGQFK